MACSCARPNYKGPGVGIWALALAVEFAAGALMVFLGTNSVADAMDMSFDNNITDIINDGNAWKVVNVFGWLHLVIAATCGVFAVLGLFVCGVFSCPLCILGWVQTTFCVASTITTAVYLRGYLNTLPSQSGSPSFSTGDIFFAQLNSGGLLAASVLSFCSAIAMSRAVQLNNADSIPGAFLSALVHIINLLGFIRVY